MITVMAFGTSPFISRPLPNLILVKYSWPCKHIYPLQKKSELDEALISHQTGENGAT